MALVDADARMASYRSAGRSDCSFIPPRHTKYAVRGEHASGRAVPVNESLLAHFEKYLRPSLFVGLSVCDSMSLESEALSYSMWVLSWLLGFVRLQGFAPVDLSLFSQLVTAFSKSLAHQAQGSASHAACICHKCREFYLSHLPAYFSDVNKHSMLDSPAVFADSLFRGEDFACFLDATHLSSSLCSQQSMVDVASRGPSASSSRLRRSPNHSPARRRRRVCGSPSRPQKKVRFDSPAPASALKSPRKFHFWD